MLQPTLVAIGGGFLGGVAAGILGTPGGLVAGAAYGIAAALGGLVVSNITYACYNPVGDQDGDVTPILTAVKAAAFALGLIASIAAGWGVLVLIGVPVTLVTAVSLHLTIACIVLATLGVALAVALTAYCLCGDEFQ